MSSSPQSIMNLPDAFSTEMKSDCKSPVINLMESQENVTEKGGTMRLGAWDCDLKLGSAVRDIYKAESIKERHRHRYEFNSKYKTKMEAAGMLATGLNPDTGLVEIIELPSHPWFIGVQFHPEFKSRPFTPHPLFSSFIKAVYKNKGIN